MCDREWVQHQKRRRPNWRAPAHTSLSLTHFIQCWRSSVSFSLGSRAKRIEQRKREKLATHLNRRSISLHCPGHMLIVVLLLLLVLRIGCQKEEEKKCACGHSCCCRNGNGSSASLSLSLSSFSRVLSVECDAASPSLIRKSKPFFDAGSSKKDLSLNCGLQLVFPSCADEFLIELLVSVFLYCAVFVHKWPIYWSSIIQFSSPLFSSLCSSVQLTALLPYLTFTFFWSAATATAAYNNGLKPQFIFSPLRSYHIIPTIDLTSTQLELSLQLTDKAPSLPATTKKLKEKSKRVVTLYSFLFSQCVCLCSQNNEIQQQSKLRCTLQQQRRQRNLCSPGSFYFLSQFFCWQKTRPNK